jgi:sodium transport system permease protein
MKILIIIKKELTDQIRDKRTIIAAILMPAVIVPMLLLLTTQNTSENGAYPASKVIVINNDSQIKDIILQSYGDTQFIIYSSPQEAVIKGEADLLIDYTESDGNYNSLTLYYDSARSGSMMAYLKIYDLFKTSFSRSVITSESVKITSLTIRSETEGRTLITLSLLLPVLLMVFAASSAMSGAVDMSAGEKERATIETLLSCNIPHKTIILGKVLAASLIGFSSVVSLLTGLIISSHFYPDITGGISLLKFCGYKNLSLLLMMTSISVILFSSAGMAIGFYAKSVKEGTILTLPVIILSSALSSGLIAADPFSINNLYSIIPILNISHSLRSILYNNPDPFFFIISISANLTSAFIFLTAGILLLKKESVIFRS